MAAISVADLLKGCAATLVATHRVRVEELLAALAAGLEAVDPERAVSAHEESVPAPAAGPLVVVGVGKAAAAMSRGVAAASSAALTGWAVCPEPDIVPTGIRLLLGSHPDPDETSLAAAATVLAGVGQTDPATEILFLVSGGGSALAEVPADGLSLDDVVSSWRLLNRAGVPIEGINTVRTHLSAFKGGRLAAAARGRPYRTLLISDVAPQSPELVASGPTVPAATTPADALAVLEEWNLVDRVPTGILEHLRRRVPPPEIPPARVTVVADGTMAATATAAHLGAVVSGKRLGGLARHTAIDAIEATPPGSIRVFHGETAVEVTGEGRGGRNQEAALAAALAIEGSEWRFATFGTDGIDGPTDAAGAMVDGASAERMREAGVDPAAALANNDSHRALAAAGSLIRCGPTGTNVADVWVVDRR